MSGHKGDISRSHTGTTHDLLLVSSDAIVGQNRIDLEQGPEDDHDYFSFHLSWRDPDKMENMKELEKEIRNRGKGFFQKGLVICWETQGARRRRHVRLRGRGWTNDR